MDNEPAEDIPPYADPSTRPRLTLLDQPMPAVWVLSDSMGVTPDQARNGLLALVKAGWVIAPREPSNGMLLAYANLLRRPSKLESVIESLSKARLRWHAMSVVGTRHALKKTNEKPHGG